MSKKICCFLCYSISLGTKTIYANIFILLPSQNLFRGSIYATKGIDFGCFGEHPIGNSQGKLLLSSSLDLFFMN